VKQPVVEVARMDPSPMNPRQWCIQLKCGHEFWVTGKPRYKKAICKKCPPPNGAAK
jgi:hypothetical protein